MPQSDVFRDFAMASQDTATEELLYELFDTALQRCKIETWLHIHLPAWGASQRLDPVTIWSHGLPKHVVRGYAAHAGHARESALRQILFSAFPRRIKPEHIREDDWHGAPERRGIAEYAIELVAARPTYEMAHFGPGGRSAYTAVSGREGLARLDKEELAWIYAITSTVHLAHCRIRVDEGHNDDLVALSAAEAEVLNLRSQGLSWAEVQDRSGIGKDAQERVLASGRLKLNVARAKTVTAAAKATAHQIINRLDEPSTRIIMRTRHGSETLRTTHNES